MSKRQTQHADRRSPIRKATGTRPSASGPGERISSARDIAIYFREDCRTLADSLQLEMVVAQYYLQLRDVVSSQGVPVGDAASAGVIAELEGYGDGLSHAILRGLAHLATGDAAQRSVDAAARLAERDIGLPAKFADVGDARAVGAWRDTDENGTGDYALFTDFEHPLGRRHAIAIFVEARHGGVIKHIGLMAPMSELGPDNYGRDLETVDVARAGALLGEVVDRSFEAGVADGDDYRFVIAAARARAASESLTGS